MKILYHHRIRSKDGQAVHMEELIAALRARGADVTLCGPESFARAEFGHDPKFIGRLKTLIPKALYELLEIGYSIPSYFRLARAWRAVRPDIIYERYNLYQLAGIWLKKRRGVHLLLEVNSPLALERTMQGGLAFGRLAHSLEGWVWRNADYVLPVTQVLAGLVCDKGVAPERIIVIPNGVDTARFEDGASADAAKTALGLSGRIVIGFSGFMRDWHGLDAIVDWLAEASTPQNVHLLLIGEGPALPDLQKQAAQLGVEKRVTFAGLAGRDAIATMTAAFDIAVQPKAVSYASPLKLFEYMAAGKAIVAPAQPNIEEVLVNGVSGLLFDPARKETLKHSLDRLVQDEELRRKLGQGARKAIDDPGFTWRKNADKVLALARQCGAGRRVARVTAVAERHVSEKA